MRITPSLADIPSPWNHKAKRFIERPVYRLCHPFPPHPLANFWRLELLQDGVRHAVESDQPVLDSAPIWPKIRVGSWVQSTIYQFDRANHWCIAATPMGANIKGTNVGLIAKAPDWEDRDESPMDYAASLRANIAWFDRQEQNPNAYYREPGLPAWWWHAAESAYPQKLKFQSGSFPALASQAIRAYLTCSPRRRCRTERRIAGNSPASSATGC